MKRLTAIALFVIANFAVVGTSFAQTTLMRAKVPFNFQLNSRLMPAGTYTISKSAGVIIVRGQGNGISAMSLIGPGDDHAARGEKMVFHKYGDQYFLSELVSQTAGVSLEVPSSKQEKQAKQQQEARNGEAATQVLVAAGR